MERLKVFVAPLQAIRGKEKSSRTELHKIAKQIVPFLVRIFQLCFVNAANVPSGEAQGRGDEVFAAVEIALDGLDSLRSFIVGFSFKIEMQRCLFVRHLLSWRRNSAALVQCRKNLSSLCLNFGASVEKGSCKQRLAGAVKGQKCAVTTVAEKKGTGQTFVLPHPQDVELTPKLAALVSGITIDLIWCTGESALPSAESYHEHLSRCRLLDPWLMALDADAAGKQKDTLYKGLYKCVSVLAANPSHYGDHLVREFSMLTLKYCAASPSWKQYFKVAFKNSHSLRYRGADCIRLGLDLSQAAMTASHDNIELQSLWVDTDMLELVDAMHGFVKQESVLRKAGPTYVISFIMLKRLFPTIAAITGFYIIGLKFCSDVLDLDTACHDFAS